MAEAFGFRSGWVKDNTCPVVVKSLSNADITITYRGNDFPVTPPAIGEDRPGGGQAGYVGTVTLTGVPSATLQTETYTVTQNGVTLSGSFLTPPSATDDFSLFFTSCDSATDSANGVPEGVYSTIRTQIESGDILPCVGILHIDDHYGYTDSTTIDDSAGSTHVSSGVPQVTGLEYDYALAYLNAFGLFTDTSKPNILWGQHADRVWAMRNLPVFPQLGDHDAGANDMGYATGKNSSLSPLFATAWGLYAKFLKPLQPPHSQSADTTANHWAGTLGCCQILALDGCTNGLGDQTTIFGTNQITDILTAADTSDAFKLWAMMYCVRYLAASGTPNNTRGAQNPIGALAEYKRLVTDDSSSPKSIMLNRNLNGQGGTSIFLHGDYHRQIITKNHKAAYTSNKAEWFYSFHPGNNGDPFGLESSIVAGLDYNSETLVEYVGTPASIPHVLRIDVYGSSDPKELVIKLFDGDGAEVSSHRFVHRYSGNETVPDTWNVNKIYTSSVQTVPV